MKITKEQYMDALESFEKSALNSMEKGLVDSEGAVDLVIGYVSFGLTNGLLDASEVAQEFIAFVTAAAIIEVQMEKDRNENEDDEKDTDEDDPLLRLLYSALNEDNIEREDDNYSIDEDDEDHSEDEDEDEDSDLTDEEIELLNQILRKRR